MKQLSISLIIVFQITACLAQVVHVSSATQLQNSLISATPGQVIILADGLYTRNGGFYIPVGTNGTCDSPIKLIGSNKTVITSNSLSTGYGLRLQGNSFWILEGFTVCNSKKGIVLDRSYHIILNHIIVNKIGDEGIHLRTFSSFNTIQNCFIDSVGLTTPSCGEGIYIGSAKDNWCTFTNCNPDTCNYNIVKGNSFGNHIVSENIDIKEGTTGGIIMNNKLNGTGLNNLNGGDSWVDVKGNYYIIKCNTGINSILDGFQTHILMDGWGNNNTFSNNTMNVNGPGYGIKVITSNILGNASQNKVCSSNCVLNALLGLSNIPSQACSDTCDLAKTNE